MPKSKPHKVTPSLESITVRGKYRIPETDFQATKKVIKDAFVRVGWITSQEVGESAAFIKVAESPSGVKKRLEEIEKTPWTSYITGLRKGIPVDFSITTVEHFSDGTLVEVECRPAMWFLISKDIEKSFTENKVQEALQECRLFVKQIMSIFKGKEIEPVSVYPIIHRTEVKGRLSSLRLKKIVNLLNKAERHIVQDNCTESLKSARTAFEKMIDWQMKKRGLKQTNNYKNDLARLRSKGYLDKETEKLLHSYYLCISNIAVHEKGEIEPGIFEAQLGYGMTLIILQYLMNKLP